MHRRSPGKTRRLFVYWLFYLLFAACFVLSASEQLEARDYFDIYNPSLKKLRLYVETTDQSEKNRLFSSHLKKMLEASLLFDLSSKKSEADFSITLRNPLQHKDFYISVRGENYDNYKTTFFGIIFKNQNEKYLIRRAAQLSNRLTEELFNLKGSIGSTVTWSVDIDSRKSIYQKKYSIPDTQERVTYNFFTNYKASWNRNQNHVIYTSHTGKGSIVSLQKLKPLLLKTYNIFDDTGRISHPIWASDNTVFATMYISKRNSDVFQFEIQGDIKQPETIRLKQLRRITSSPSVETEAVPSPDAKYLAYVSDQTGQPQIYLKNLTTQKTRRLSKYGSYNVTPAWSPDGKYLAYRSIRKGQSGIYRIRLKDNKETKVTSDDIQAESPSWSPDSSLIAFAGRKTKSGPFKIYISLASGGRSLRLTNADSQANETEPVWGPPM